MAYQTFTSYWRALLPHNVVGRPLSDLCWTCQQNSNIILKSVNKSVDEKSVVSKTKMNYYTAAIFVHYLLQAIKTTEEHLVAVAKERSKYRSACKDSKSELITLFTNGTFRPPPPGSAVPPLSHDTTVHYSFDMAQQASYYHCILKLTKLGHRYTILTIHPMYFLTLRKCAIFGVCCEGVPRQVGN